MNATPGDTVAFNPPGNLQGQPDILHGATMSSQTSSPMLMPGVGPDGKKTMVLQNIPTGQTQQTPGSLQTPIPIVPDAPQMQQGQMPQAMPSLTTMMQSMSPGGQVPSMSAPSDIPNKPNPNPMPGLYDPSQQGASGQGMQVMPDALLNLFQDAWTATRTRP